MYCQSCGNETPDQGIFCLHCGARLNKECPRCAEIVRSKAKVCRFCGYEFTVEETAKMERLEQERILRDQAEQERAKREQAERERESTAEYTKAEQERVKHEKPEEKVTQSNYYFPKRIGAEQDLRVKIGRIAARARIVQYGKPITKAELEEALIALEQLNKQGQIRLGEYSEYKQLLSDGISRL